uniref:Uncharacterized protein n=1 Tax=Heterorhabditis bacteriophora TaxID=37862 RepID=A0A1I7WCX9_HETBA
MAMEITIAEFFLLYTELGAEFRGRFIVFICYVCIFIMVFNFHLKFKIIIITFDYS